MTWLWLLLLYGLRVLQSRRPARRGLRALATVFAPYGFLPALFLAVATRRRSERVLLLAAGALHGMRHRPRRRRAERVQRSTSPPFTVLTWNILFSNPKLDDMLQFLATGPAEIAALQELTAEHVERINSDPALREVYPHQIAWTHGYGAGMGLLSRYPISEQGRLERPPTLWARLELGDGQQIVLVSGHPTFFPPRMTREDSQRDTGIGDRLRRILDPRFLIYNPDYRDDGIRQVRAFVDRLRHDRAPVLVVGDFNVTEREPAYGDLTAGLGDAARYAARGNALTWRPEWLTRLPLPILRIDYMLHSPGLRALEISVDRRPRGSDHCPVHGTFELVDDAGSSSSTEGELDRRDLAVSGVDHVA